MKSNSPIGNNVLDKWLAEFWIDKKKKECISPTTNDTNMWENRCS